MWRCSAALEKQSNALIKSRSGAVARVNAYKTVFLLHSPIKSAFDHQISELLWKEYVDSAIEVACGALEKERGASKRLFQSATQATLSHKDQRILSLCALAPKPYKRKCSFVV